MIPIFPLSDVLASRAAARSLLACPVDEHGRWANLPMVEPYPASAPPSCGEGNAISVDERLGLLSKCWRGRTVLGRDEN